MGWMVRRSNSVEGDIFLTLPDLPWSPPTFSVEYSVQGVALTTHPRLTLKLKKE